MTERHQRVAEADSVVGGSVAVSSSYPNAFMMSAGGANAPAMAREIQRLLPLQALPSWQLHRSVTLGESGDAHGRERASRGDERRDRDGSETHGSDASHWTVELRRTRPRLRPRVSHDSMLAKGT